MPGDKAIKLTILVSLVSLLSLPTSAWASVHLWKITEIFSDATGTRQFVELQNPNFSNQQFFNGTRLISTKTFNFTENLSSSTTNNKYVLMGTAGFASLTNAPTPDFIIPDDFFSINGDTIRFTGSGDSVTFGVLPLDGISSINGSLATGVNSPTNFAGATGSVVVPEPQSLAMILLALMGLFGWRRGNAQLL